MMRGRVLTSGWVMAALFAAMMGMFGIVLTAGAVDPMSNEKALVAKTAEMISLNIDTMASVGEGSLLMPIRIDGFYKVRVRYEKEGNDNGYMITDDGWYVLVSFKKDAKEYTHASRIRSYPAHEQSALEMSSNRPGMLCIKKAGYGSYPVLSDEASSC